MSGEASKRCRGRTDRQWDFTFTQEWPILSQRHQFSYTVPYSFVETGGEGGHGIGDVLLNYRFQAWIETETFPAFAPRLSFLLPFGDGVLLPTGERHELGNGHLGYQVNLPFSKVVHDRWTIHGNAGITVIPGVEDRNPLSRNIAASAIFAATARFNFLLEATAEWNEEVEAGKIVHTFETILSPGLRCAFNLHSGQLVLGLGLPIGLTKDAPDYGLLIYLSFEHNFSKR